MESDTKQPQMEWLLRSEIISRNYYSRVGRPSAHLCNTTIVRHLFSAAYFTCNSTCPIISKVIPSSCSDSNNSTSYGSSSTVCIIEESLAILSPLSSIYSRVDEMSDDGGGCAETASKITGVSGCVVSFLALALSVYLLNSIAVIVSLAGKGSLTSFALLDETM